eukprot:TRINITY_DN29545_c0_g1_i1.p1 TRINITY_DN29545_c0_g1~~TRINITY_DN29545_c0_g1_i1.p1  ORF type:complete len:400 (-),score=81.02 TRINITY_DN29545_c0_g1_i1:146-1345(-)
MAASSHENVVSFGVTEAKACEPELKPKIQSEFNSDGAHSFSTPSKKDTSEMFDGHSFISPPKKHRPSASGGFFDAFNVHTTSTKKRVPHAFDDQCSTAAPSPAWTSTTPASPWRLPFASSGSSIEYDPATFLPSPRRPPEFLPSVPCGVNGALSFGHEALGHEPLALAACPSTPRIVSQLFAEREMSTPPTTPRARHFRHDESQPPLPSTPRRKPAPPMLTALQVNSVVMVRDVIADDAEAALTPFWDHNIEPPLCCAVRLGCDAPIISHLLVSRADVNATNAEGITALDIVRRPARRRGDDVGLSDPIFAFASAFPSEQNNHQVESLLLTAGACPSEAEAVASKETSSSPPTFNVIGLRLPGDHDVGCQFVASSAWPTIPPWQLPAFEGLRPSDVEND